jgi:hypothetical protein
LFLRNALREKAIEERVINKAIKALRPILQRVERLVEDSGVMQVGPRREERLRGLSVAIARMIRDDWGTPQLQALQADLAPFIDAQMEFARTSVTAAGGTIVAPGAAVVPPAATVTGAVVGGKPLGQVLTSSFPATIADRVERFVRVGMIGEVEVRTFDDAVGRPTLGNVQAIFRTAVHETGSAAQEAIWRVETDPAWLGEEGLIWTAILDSQVCPVCAKLDGQRFPADYKKVSPHAQCRCYLLPWKWRVPDMVNPQGEKVPIRRPVEGDDGEAELPFKVAAKQWVKDNPKTAQEIFGKKLGQDLIDGKISFDKAVKLWSSKRS